MNIPKMKTGLIPSSFFPGYATKPLRMRALLAITDTRNPSRIFHFTGAPVKIACRRGIRGGITNATLVALLYEFLQPDHLGNFRVLLSFGQAVYVAAL